MVPGPLTLKLRGANGLLRPRTTWWQSRRPLTASGGSSRRSRETTSEADEAVASHVVAACSNLNDWLRSGHAPRGFAKAGGELGAAAGVYRNAAVAFKSLADVDGDQREAARTHVPPSWNKVTITWRYSSLPWRRSSVTQRSRGSKSGHRRDPTDARRPASSCLIRIGQSRDLTPLEKKSR